MKLKVAISNVIILAVLLGQINIPLFVHICSKMQTVSFLSSCKMHEPVRQKHSCCDKDESKEDALQLHSNDQNQAENCVVVFSKEHSADGSITSLINVDAGLHSQGYILTEQIQNSFSSLLNHTFIDTSPTVSPPLFLLNSSLRI